jgi:MFS family permease
LIGTAGFALRFAHSAVPAPDERSSMRAFDFLTVAPLIACAALLDGILFMGIQALLPTYSLASGLSAAAATRTIAWFAVGMLVLPFLVGMLVDRYTHPRVLIASTVILALILWTLPVGFDHTFVRPLVLIALGGLVNGIYTVTLSMVGARFRGGHLAAATAGATMLFSLGELIGPPIVGASMDVAPSGYYISLGALCSVFLIAIVWFAGERRFSATELPAEED